MFKVGIIGCGLIGSRRAKFLGNRAKLVACNDFIEKRALDLAKSYEGVKIYKTSQELIEDKTIDIVIISTLHDSLASLTLKALENKKHILVEKPAARSSSELLPVIKKSIENNLTVHVGFNHRFHRSFQKAKDLVTKGVIGDLMFIRGRYGHGGRLGYENEWRANPSLSGGGELLDQGPHLIDLSQWLFGKKLKYISSKVGTFYWDMAVDDNAFLLLETEENQTAFLHVSCTEWKNTFSFEIYGKKGKLEITGLGGSYGIEKLSHYNMLPEMGPPETNIYEYPMADNSWLIEFESFIDDIIHRSNTDCGLVSAQNVLEIIDKSYNRNN